MGDQFRTIQERIEDILVLMKAAKKSKDRVRLLRDFRVLLDEADRNHIQKPAPQPSLPMVPKASPAD